LIIIVEIKCDSDPDRFSQFFPAIFYNNTVPYVVFKPRNPRYWDFGSSTHNTSTLNITKSCNYPFL